MSDMPFKALLKRLSQYLVSYVSNYLDYLRFEAAERVVDSLSYVISNVVAIMVLVLCLNITFLSLTLAWGIAFNAIPLALIVIAAFYLLIGLVLILFRKSIISRPLQKQIVTLLFKNS
jgi:hypothetical protein